MTDHFSPLTLRYLYLLGYPLGHSVSPAMQNAALAERGIAETRYVKKPVPPEELADAVEALRAARCLGANVTVPHKQSIAPLLDELTPLAREIGAVNTILKREGKLVGDNTDVYGFLQALWVRRIPLKGVRAVILGAGGAAAGAGYALGQAGVKEIVLVNRTAARSHALAERLNEKFPALTRADSDWGAVGKAQLIVNATSAGMSPHPDKSPLPDAVSLERGAVVFDLVYNPPTTRLLGQARRQGARTIGGLDMLIYQGARAFQLWTGARAPVRVMRTAATAALQEMMLH